MTEQKEEGKYDGYAAFVQDMTDANAAIVIVIGGALGSGFSVSGKRSASINLPLVLRDLANQIEAVQAEEKKGAH